jgi:hypothetical protein
VKVFCLLDPFGEPRFSFPLYYKQISQPIGDLNLMICVGHFMSEQ